MDTLIHVYGVVASDERQDPEFLQADMFYALNDTTTSLGGMRWPRSERWSPKELEADYSKSA